jgi:hypothetical protein
VISSLNIVNLLALVMETAISSVSYEIVIIFIIIINIIIYTYLNKLQMGFTRWQWY